MKRSKIAEHFAQRKRFSFIQRESTENHREVIDIQSSDELHGPPKYCLPFVQTKQEVTAFRHEVVDLCSSSDEESQSGLERNCAEPPLEHQNIAKECNQLITQDSFPLPVATTPTPTYNKTETQSPCALDDDFPDDSEVAAILSGAMYSGNVCEDRNEGRENQGLNDGCSGDEANECEKDSSGCAKLASSVLTAEPVTAGDKPVPISPRQQRDAAAEVLFRTHGASALPLLVQSLRTGTPPEKENAASIIRSLVKKRHMKEMVLAAGAVGSSAGQAHAASALKSLAGDPAASAAMVGKGAIHALVQLLLRKDKSPAAAVVKAVEALQNLSIYPAYQGKIVRQGAVPPLVDCVTCNSAARLQQRAVEVLWNLVQTAAHREAIVVEGGVLALRLCAQYSACAATRKRADLLVKLLTQRSS